MKHLLLSAAAALAVTGSTLAYSNCIGSGSYQHCYDAQSGNSYDIQQYGNTTLIQGNNTRTGSTWSQNSHTLGNTTIHNGTAADGNTWNGTSTQIGNTTHHYGTDSSGNSYSSRCNQFGCN